jgi:hypothetical protein
MRVNACELANAATMACPAAAFLLAVATPATGSSVPPEQTAALATCLAASVVFHAASGLGAPQPVQRALMLLDIAMVHRLAVVLWLRSPGKRRRRAARWAACGLHLAALAMAVADAPLAPLARTAACAASLVPALPPRRRRRRIAAWAAAAAGLFLAAGAHPLSHALFHVALAPLVSNWARGHAGV